jgi:hypothetical protein
MIQNMTYGTFIFFGAMCVFAAAFVYFMVPETKNLTLEEMDEVFGDEAGTGVEDRNRMNRIYVELGLLTHEELGMSGDSETKTESLESSQPVEKY